MPFSERGYLLASERAELEVPGLVHWLIGAYPECAALPGGH